MSKRGRKRKGSVGIVSIIVSLAVLTLIAIGVVKGGEYSPDTLISQLTGRQDTQALINDIYIDPDEIPEYDDSPFVEINGNVPELDLSDAENEFEIYDPLDELGRCRAAYANVSPLTMPDKERESIGQVKPAGWHLVKYDWIDGRFLYNRCHLIGYQLTGENANERNLITGTRYMNTEGMLPFEIQIADYVKKTGNHVLYKVVPVFRGNNLLADGVWMQARSVEDDELQFNVFCYNIQPGVGIDYKNGDSWKN